MINPRFDVNQEVYVRSSAGIGILEAYYISGLYQRGNGWVYTIRTGRRPPRSPNTYGNQQSLVTGSMLYLSEDELIDKCTALVMAEAYTLAAYTRMKGLREAYCPQSPTEG